MVFRLGRADAAGGCASVIEARQKSASYWRCEKTSGAAAADRIRVCDLLERNTEILPNQGI